ncbi:hypothetical protein C8Q76DRAFT_194111 [Earliella scabrosa]|nr:hypothetical protein C8Q76DRAFT_194111 [Earliella scabrosa]
MIVLPALQKVRARVTPRNLALPTFAPEYETVLPYLWTARVLSSWAARRAMRRMLICRQVYLDSGGPITRPLLDLEQSASSMSS